MKSRYFVFLLFIFGLFCTANGQKDSTGYVAHDRAMHSDDSAVVHHMNTWIRSNLFDDWFVEFQGGGQLYYGTDDRLGRFGDRLTANGELYIGRRIFPMFGFRLGMGYGYAHGFLTKQNHAHLAGHGGTGQCGIDDNGNLLGGYYWPYDKDNNLLIQKWKYFYFGGDLFLDLGILQGTDNYNPYRLLSHIIYGGVHTKFGRSETDTPNHRTEAHAGYICRWNITPELGLFADLRGSFIERTFDREWVNVKERARFGLDFILNAQLGVIYKFHMRSEDKRDLFVYTVKQKIIEDHQIVHFTFIDRNEDVRDTIIDTLLNYQLQLVPTAETQNAIDSLRHVLDSLMNMRQRRADGLPLDSILLKELLPYEIVFFELDKWDILESEKTKISKMARIMKAYPNETFVLTGSADSKTGTPHRNAFLSHNRADVIYNELIQNHGIPASQLRREYVGGVLDFKPFELNRCTIIIMDHPSVKKAIDEIKKKGHASSGEVRIDK